MPMRDLIIGVLIIVCVLGVAGYVAIAAGAEIQRRHERWLWTHPPEEDVCREDEQDEQDQSD